MGKLIPLICLVLFFMSCGQHPLTATLSNTSPDGKTKIQVTAKKEASLDPFTVTLDVKSADLPEGTLQFEISASTLDSSNVTFDWRDAQECRITFTQSDGDKRIFALTSSGSSVVVGEVKKD